MPLPLILGAIAKKAVVGAVAKKAGSMLQRKKKKKVVKKKTVAKKKTTAKKTPLRKGKYNDCLLYTSPSPRDR